METCGTELIRLLEHYEVECVFGIPGNHTLELYRGLKDSSIRHITTRHEQGAGFMADGYARACGRPGVCFLISGPGLLNAATAIAQARQDSIPMLVITAVAASNDIPEPAGRLHELPDQRAAALSFCASSYTVHAPSELAGAIGDAFSRFVTERPGPIHIQLPLDVLQMPPAKASTPKAAPAKRRATPASVDAAAAALMAAQRPLLMLGGGATGAANAVELAEQLDLPVLNTVNAKGVVPKGHPLAVGGSPSMGCLNEALSSADVVLAIGTEFGETDYDLLMAQELKLNGTLVRVDVDARQLNRNQHADIALLGDSEQIIAQLLAATTSCSRDGAARASALRDRVQQEQHFRADFAAFFDTLAQTVPGLVLVGDSTRPTYYASWQYETTQPRSYFHSVSGFGTLGYAIPAAFGAAIGTRRPVAALIGDGGAQFTLTELGTAVDANLNVPVLVWQNSGYEEIANSLAGRAIDTDSTVISCPNFADIARAYDIPCYEPADLAELRSDLSGALRLDGPSLIVIEQSKFTHSESGKWYG